MAYSGGMKWKVSYHADFADELASHGEKVLDALEERIMLLEEYGHMLGRPHADTLNGSKHSNMKELMYDADGGVWRVAFAFDPERRAILLVAGDKSGQSQRRFYKSLIASADQRFDQHLEFLKAKDE